MGGRRAQRARLAVRGSPTEEPDRELFFLLRLFLLLLVLLITVIIFLQPFFLLLVHPLLLVLRPGDAMVAYMRSLRRGLEGAGQAAPRCCATPGNCSVACSR